MKTNEIDPSLRPAPEAASRLRALERSVGSEAQDALQKLDEELVWNQ